MIMRDETMGHTVAEIMQTPPSTRLRDTISEGKGQWKATVVL